MEKNISTDNYLPFHISSNVCFLSACMSSNLFSEERWERMMANEIEGEIAEGIAEMIDLEVFLL